MIGWTYTKDIRKKLEREWAQGKYLVARLHGEGLCPKRIHLKTPQTQDWTENYDATRAWLSELTEGGKNGDFTIEWREVNHRLLGRNKFPLAVIFETDESVLKFIGKQSAARKFDSLYPQILNEFPELKCWVEKRTHVVLDHQMQWPRLLAVMKFLRNHPRPNIYVRQLEIPEIDTKFIETHQKLLTELLDIILPAEFIDSDAKGAREFTQRYGFIPKPIQVRFRILDPEFYLAGLSDLQIPVVDFCKLNLAVEKVFITENDINGLAFPEIPGAIVIFGLGFGLDRLTNVQWLHSKKIYYWGDIDTHGFVMLDQIRSYFPQTISFLMDEEILLAHRSLWGSEDKPSKRELTHLVGKENEVYESVKNNTFSDSLRLEQEKISFTDVLKVVKELSEE